MRVVVALRNAAVGRALSDIGVIVLDAAGLAAPSIVEACLRTAVHRVRLDDDDFLVVEVESPRDATLRELYGDVAPLALVRRRRKVRRRSWWSPRVATSRCASMTGWCWWAPTRSSPRRVW